MIKIHINPILDIVPKLVASIKGNIYGDVFAVSIASHILRPVLSSVEASWSKNEALHVFLRLGAQDKLELNMSDQTIDIFICHQLWGDAQF